MRMRGRFDPREIPGCHACFLAEDIPGIHGADVASWPDRCGGDPLVQATPSSKPTLSVVGSKKGVLYDAVDDRLARAVAGDAVLRDGDTTVITLVRLTDDRFDDATSLLFAFQSDAGKPYVFIRNSTNGYGVFGRGHADLWIRHYGDVDTGDNAFVYRAPAWTVAGFTADPPDANLHRFSVPLVMSSWKKTADCTETDYGITVGSVTGGIIYACVIYTRRLSDLECRMVVEELADEIGLELDWRPTRLPQKIAEFEPALLEEAVGATVATLSDRVGSYDLEQATEANKPTVALHNGRKCLQFDGVDDFLDFATDVPIGTDDQQIFLVLADVEDTGADQMILAGGAQSKIYVSDSDGKIYFLLTSDNAEDRDDLGDTVVEDAGIACIAYVREDYSTNCGISTNGTPYNNDATAFTAGVGQGWSRLGAFIDGSLPAKFKLLYLLIVAAPLSGREEDRFEAVMNARAGI